MTDFVKPVKLIYFTFKARGEVARLAMDYGNVKFEDYKYEREDYNEEEAMKYPFNQLPVLELEDGTTMAQSYAIMTYLGRMTGTFPTDPLMAAYVNQALYTCEDFLRKIFDLGKFSGEEREEKYQNVKNVYMPSNLKKFNDWVSEMGSNGYIVGNSMTVADFQFFVVCEYLKSTKMVESITNEDAIMKDFPALCAAYHNVRSYPAFQKRFEAYSN